MCPCATEFVLPVLQSHRGPVSKPITPLPASVFPQMAYPVTAQTFA